MTSHRHDSPFGMRVLKAFCLLICFFALLNSVYAILGFSSLYATPEGHAAVVISNLIGLSYGFLFYGLHRRFSIAWKFGWLVLVSTFLWFLIEALTSLHRTSQSGGWIGFGTITIAISAVAVYWGRWWYRQRSYFS